MKFVSPFNHQETLKWLKIVENSREESNLTRKRAQGVRLSSEGMKINEIALVCDVGRNAVSRWIDAWEKQGIDSLLEAPRSGRIPIIDESDYETVVNFVQEEPRQLKRAVERISQEMNKSLSTDTLKRILKKKFSWRRFKKSLKEKRDEKAFQEGRQIIAEYEEEENEGAIDLYYFDESGFSLVPNVPYGWQPQTNPIELPSSLSKRLNVLGFFSRSNDFTPYVFEGSINSTVVISCFEDFIQSISKKSVVVIDNASIHTSQLFLNKIQEWEGKGLFLYNLPSYSPELNKIEILWRRIKYSWISLKAYTSMDTLRKELDEVLVNIGKKYHITFA